MEYEHVIQYRNIEPSPTHKTKDCSAFVKIIPCLDMSDVTINLSIISLVQATYFIKHVCKNSLIKNF